MGFNVFFDSIYFDRYLRLGRYLDIIMLLFLGDALLALGSISSCGSRLPEIDFCYWGMQKFRLIPRHVVLGHTPYLSGSFGRVCLCRQILVEMLSHILIFGGFITSLLDDIHVILGHIPYPPRSSGIYLFVHTIVIERMSLVMTFSGFHHVFIDAILGHILYLSRSFGRGWFVQTVLIDDMSHCYDIFGLHHVSVGCHTRAYPSNFAFTIFRSEV